MSINSYLKTNLELVFLHRVEILMVSHFIAESGFLICLILFWNNYFKVKKRFIINIIFCCLVLINFLWHLSQIFYGTFLFYGNKAELPLLMGILKDIISVTAMLYCIVITIINYRILPTQGSKKLIRILMVVIVVFLPGMIFDAFFNKWQFVIFVPAFFIIIGILFLHDLISNINDYNTAYQDPDALKKIFKEYNLSIREVEVALLLSKGYTNKQIADNLFISVSTVKAHSFNIYKKLKVSSRHEIIALAYGK